MGFCSGIIIFIMGLYHNSGYNTYNNTYNIYLDNWLVVDLSLWKMMDFVSWDDDIPNWMESHKIHVPVTTNQIIYVEIEPGFFGEIMGKSSTYLHLPLPQLTSPLTWVEATRTFPDQLFFLGTAKLGGWYTSNMSPVHLDHLGSHES